MSKGPAAVDSWKWARVIKSHLHSTLGRRTLLGLIDRLPGFFPFFRRLPKIQRTNRPGTVFSALGHTRKLPPHVSSHQRPILSSRFDAIAADTNNQAVRYQGPCSAAKSVVAKLRSIEAKRQCSSAVASDITSSAMYSKARRLQATAPVSIDEQSLPLSSRWLGKEVRAGYCYCD